MEKRTNRRMASKHATTVALFTDSQQHAYGVLTDVSVTGACIVTDRYLDPGSKVDLKLSFYQQPSLYEIAARVVWSRGAGAHENGFEDLPLHGVQFTLSSSLQKSHLLALLASKDFVDVFRPSATEYDLFLNALNVELDELGSAMDENAGEKS